MAKEENKIVYGDRVFLQNQLKNGNCYLAASLLFESLEANVLEFDLTSDDTSLMDFQRNAPIEYRRGDRRIGIFHVQNVERTGAQTYHFYATSIIGLLSEGTHYGGIYTGQTVAEVLPSIFGSIPYIIKSNLQEIKLYGWLPVAVPRDNLSQVLFAIGATIKVDMDNIPRIEPLWDGIASDILKNRLYANSNVKYTSKITQVSVTEHQYVQGTDSKQLFEGTAQEGDIITFDEPMHSLSASGFAIRESGANFARLSAGSGTLTGLTYIHNTRQVTRDVTAAQTPNVKTVTDATLVSLVNSHAAAERLADYYKHLETIDAPVVYQGEAPGDRVHTWHPFDDTAVPACLQSADITLSNTLRAQERLLVGFIPPQPDSAEYYNTSELITKDGTWTVPEGVTSIRVVLIGGGWGGYSGLSGSASPEGEQTSSSTSVTGHTNYDAGILISPGGAGGGPGQGGSGGKVLSVSIDVTPGQVFAVKIGVGGAGGSPSGSVSSKGSEGTPSTFGSYSSANGGVIPGGWQEEMSGDRYATDGTSGIAGGKGNGNTASGNTNVVNGPSVSGYSPGANRNSDTKDTEYNAGTSSNVNYTQAICSGGCGGGAAYGANGGAGSPASSGSVSASSSYASAQGAPGGAGATAQPPPDQTLIGAGGTGGNGGGGGGGRGYARCRHSSSSGRGSLNPRQASAGPGGSGSRGGKGGPGGIWVYYSLRRPIQSGQFVTRDKQWLLGALKRRFIV